MHTKLTLRLDGSLIARAKKYARHNRKSISRMVADYFTAIENPRSNLSGKRRMGPVSSRLCGSLKGAKLDENAYKRHVESKYL